MFINIRLHLIKHLAFIYYFTMFIYIENKQMKKICITLLSQPKTSLSARGLKTQGEIGQRLTPSDMDLAMFYSFYHILVHKITYDSSHAIKGM